MKKFLLALLAFISISCPAFASDWVYLGDNQNDEPAYLDRASIVKSYGITAGWMKSILPDGGKVLYNISARESDRSIAVVSCVVYDTEGKVIGQYTSPIPAYNPVVPDSLGEVIYNFLMENAKSNV
jgi:hypothetical protein